ncbi:hypothetical protein FQ154_01580 [Paeniglutamicibacter gangotriensis]|uniref:Uncharacterized protein n=1 Tax=Paeniglutamicibacter gangotriensis TaxID=254787 RepID=A0A5B0EM69_9MICC|nr:hypothetical protein [Paeniglutamicibacter gangotriensis]KAA0979876.1 hypothetical protein FQ154_01580 [Paeniglutamicibacter gangotriensis]
MTAYIGPWGNLVGFKCPSGLDISSETRSSYKTTMGGRVVEQRGPRGRRTWQASLATAMPSEIAGLEALEMGVLGKPPWVWVPPNAQSQNLFAPEASVMAQGSYSNSAIPGGSVVADDGVLVPATASALPGATLTFGSPGGILDPIPVIPAVPLTVSVYAAGAFASMTLTFRNITGAYIATHTTAVTAAMSRHSITRTAPAGAVDAFVRVIAGSAASARVGNPAATWTSMLMPWSVGRGCNKVTVEGLSESLQMAVKDEPGMNRSSHQFTVKELG